MGFFFDSEESSKYLSCFHLILAAGLKVCSSLVCAHYG